MKKYLFMLIILVSCHKESTEFQQKFNELKDKKQQLFSKKEIVHVSKTIIVDGIFDGGFRHYVWIGEGDCSQKEGMPPMFKILSNSTLKNLSIENAPDGIHIYGDKVTIQNIYMDNVCEDAISVKGKRKEIIIENNYFANCEDKGIQLTTELNKADIVTIRYNLFEKCTCAVRIKENNGNVHILNNYFLESLFGVRANLSKNITINNNHYLKTQKAILNESSDIKTADNYLSDSNK